MARAGPRIGSPAGSQKNLDISLAEAGFRRSKAAFRNLKTAFQNFETPFLFYHI